MDAASDATLGLAAGIALAMRQLRANAGEATKWNLKQLRKDPGFLLLLSLSCASFVYTAEKETTRLLSERRAAAKAAKQAQLRSAASLVAVGEAVTLPPPSAVVAKPKKEAKPKRDDKFWTDLRFLCNIAFPGGLFSRGGGLLVSQFGLLVVRTLLTVHATKLSTYSLTRAISQASWRYWSRWAVNFVGWMSAATVVNSGLRYTESLISYELRSSLTRAAHAKYLAHNAFYKTNVLRQGGIDHVDQRVCHDIAAFSKEAASLYGHSFKPILEFALTLTESAAALGYKRPIALFASQIVVTGALRSLTPSLSRMVQREAELEGSFRAAHSRLIAHAEEVAFLKGADTERNILNGRLTALISTQRWHALQRIRRSVSENIGKFQGLLVGGVFVHIPFLAAGAGAAGAATGEGVRISAFRATEEMMLRCGSAFVEVLQLGKALDELAGHTERISTLFRALDPAPTPADAAAAKRTSVGPIIAFRGATVAAPEPGGERVLVKALTLEVQPGESLIVTGPNGAGKTALLRVLSGLWPPSEGCVECPATGIFWLPQRPFLATGTLRDQVTYPHLSGFQRRFDARVMECLQLAGVGRLAETAAGLDREHAEWGDVLSGGERQRIGFARLFYAQPQYAVLDESTSAVNVEGETALYEEVARQKVTIISVAHRMALMRFHSWELRLKGDGSGEWERVAVTHPDSD